MARILDVDYTHKLLEREQLLVLRHDRGVPGAELGLQADVHVNNSAVASSSSSTGCSVDERRPDAPD